MDGFFEGAAISDSSDSGAHISEADRRYLARKGPAYFVAAAQTAFLALALLLEFHAGGSISTGDYVKGVLTICGFAIAAFYWAATWNAGGIGSICEEILRRGLHVAALTFLSTVAYSLVKEAEVPFTNSRTFLALLGVSWIGIGILAIIGVLGRQSKARCIMVFGDGQTSSELTRRIKREMPSAKICIWPVTALPSAAEHLTPNIPVLAHPTIVELAPDVALISAVTSDAEMASLTAQLAPFAIDVLVDARLRSRRMPGAVEMFAGLSFLRVFPKPLTPYQKLIKRGFDIVASSLLIALLFPLLCLIGFVLKIDSRGPILFTQPRVGRYGAHFTILKFRTMVDGAADLLAEKSTVPKDPRLTRLGALLRKTSLDELPQLFNVLLGTMSLVGPRPHAMNGNFFHFIMANYPARHRVKPGITGLAQVSGWRGPTDTASKVEQRVANDLRYIGEWSLVRDIVIICRTFFALYGKNAF